MDSTTSHSLWLLVILSILCLQSKADGTGSVLFLDSPSQQYLRTRPEIKSMELQEAGAAMSVLLGFAPPATLSAASSSKLNDVLTPNPFNRPRSLLVLEVAGDSQIMVDSGNAISDNAFRSEITSTSDKADIQIQDEDEFSVFSLNEPFTAASDLECTEKDLTDFASWLGGSYVTDTLEPLNGKLTFTSTGGAPFDLHLSKKADRAFITSLISLTRNVRRAIEMHQDLSGMDRRPAELMTGSFDGIKILQEQYGTEGVAQQGVDLFFASLHKIFDTLQAAYKGEIVGVILFHEASASDSHALLNVKFTSRPSARSLEETATSPELIIAEILLVRRTLAWITGLVLLIATLLGIYFLMNMPLTKDTLLYSNVKLD